MANDDRPDLIQVQAETRHEIAADRADIHVTVKGSSLVSGRSALNKAREVALLVQDLQDQGVTSDDIYLQGVSAEVSGGSVLKSSQSSYRLRIRCSNLEKLADVLGAITAQKNSHLRTIDWLYPEDEEVRDAWLVSALRRAGEKSSKVASVLGVRLIGVYQFTEHWASDEQGSEWPAPSGAGEATGMRRRAQMTAEDLGLEIYHTKTVSLRVVVSYRVSGFVAGSDADV